MSWRDTKLRPANEFAGYVNQVALRRLPTHSGKTAIEGWGGEPAQAGLVQLVARGFNRCADSDLRVVSLDYARLFGAAMREQADG